MSTFDITAIDWLGSGTSEQLASAVVLPIQFFGARPGFGCGRPEGALMHAVLEDAISCFQKGLLPGKDRRTRRLAKEAEAWLFDDDTSWPFSFLNICAALDIVPGYLRRGLIRWQSQPSTVPVKQTKRRAHSVSALQKIAA